MMTMDVKTVSFVIYIYIYVGSTGLTFKNRYTKHKHSFRHEKTVMRHLYQNIFGN